MAWMIDVVSMAIGLGLGVGLTWFFYHTKITRLKELFQMQFREETTELRARAAASDIHLKSLREEATAQSQELAHLRENLRQETAAKAASEARLEQERQAFQEKLILVEQAKDQLTSAFKALAADALKTNNQQFLDLAKSQLAVNQEQAKSELEKRQVAIAELISPVQQSLEKMDSQIRVLEKERVGAYATLHQQIATMAKEGEMLRTETANLVKALRQSHMRGAWGELQLRRIVELTGMLAHCDFIEQNSLNSENGALRPDMTIHLAGGRTIVVDAKAPLDGFLEASQMTDEKLQKAALERHARLVRTKVKELSSKTYWEQFPQSPEFVILFLPGDSFLQAALSIEPSLIEISIEQHKVLLATPTTLIGLLKAVAHGWREARLAENAQKISEEGSRLYNNLTKFGEHITHLGKQIKRTVEAYNDSVGSLEARVLPTARRLNERYIKNPGSTLESLEGITEFPRSLQAPDFQADLNSLPEKSDIVVQ